MCYRKPQVIPKLYKLLSSVPCGEKVAMSIESLGQLESRIQNLIDKLELSKMEVEDLRLTNSRLEDENLQLKQELGAWGDKVSSLLGKLDVINSDEEEKEEEAALV